MQFVFKYVTFITEMVENRFKQNSKENLVGHKHLTNPEKIKVNYIVFKRIVWNHHILPTIRKRFHLFIVGFFPTNNML